MRYFGRAHQHRPGFSSRPYALVILLIVVIFSAPVYANPQQGRVVAGAAGIQSTGKTLTVHQKSDRVIIHWGRFDIAKGETTQFFQPSASAMALNRVMTTGQASRISGALKSNGQIILVNPNGAIFGSAARVNVGSLIVSSADIGDAAFMKSKSVFVFGTGGRPDAAIVNQGEITVAENGLAAFVAPDVRNSGVIQGRASRMILAGGDVFAVDLYGDGLMNLAVQQDDRPRHLAVSNGGNIVNDAGSVLLTAAAAHDLVSNVVNTSGHIRARGIGRKNGRVVLMGERLEATGALDVSGDPQGGNGGFVETSASRVLNIEGLRVDASAAQGAAGTWLIDPEDIHIVAPDAVPAQGRENYVSVTTLESALANVTLLATRDISFEENVVMKYAAVGLGATAGRDLFMTGTGITTQGGAVDLRAGNSLNLNRAVIVTKGGDVTLNAFNPDVRTDGALFMSNSMVDTTGGVAVGAFDIQGGGGDAFLQRPDNYFQAGNGGGKITAQAEWIEGRNNSLKAGEAAPAIPEPPVIIEEPPVIVPPPAVEPPPVMAPEAPDKDTSGFFNTSRLTAREEAEIRTQADLISDGTSLLEEAMFLPEMQDISPAAGGNEALDPVFCANSFLAGGACQ